GSRAAHRCAPATPPCADHSGDTPRHASQPRDGSEHVVTTTDLLPSRGGQAEAEAPLVTRVVSSLVISARTERCPQGRTTKEVTSTFEEEDAASGVQGRRNIGGTCDSGH